MRRIAQPGPAPAERIQCVPSGGRRFADMLPAGATLLDAVHGCFARHGFTSGVLSLRGGALNPFGYVIPALSETPDHAAFYSAPFRPSGLSRIEAGAMTVGTRDDEKFFHCHAVWIEADGSRHCGHILPEETFLAEPIAVDCVGLTDALFAARPDPETNFKLFGPVGPGSDGSFFALRLRPHEDICGALERFCRDRGIAAARLHGGVGSIIGARFDDGRVVEPFATEMAITSGRIATGADGTSHASIDVVLIDYTGAIADGRLMRGDNPIFITLEVVLEAVEA